ncbi:hypothetical protein ACSS6W_000420 [Trichoderma asperelloides]
MDLSSHAQNSVLENLKEMQDMVQRLQRIQILQERRIMQLGHQLESYRERRAEFAQFSRLPPELRRQIWELAIPSQVFRPFRYLEPSYPEWKSLPPPAISRVCREARHVAYQQGALYRHEYLAPIFWTWFSGQRDILDLSPYCMSENGFIPLQTSLLREAKAIILDAGLVNDPLIAGLNSKSSQLEKVETIYLTVGNPSQVGKRSWHPHAVARLFRDRSFALVDIEDGQELERLEQILQMSGSDEVNLMNWWHRDAITRLQDQIRPPADKMRAWRDAKQLLLQGWISYHCPTLPLPESFFDENGKIMVQEVRMAHPQIPKVQLVQAFELIPVSRCAKWRMLEDIRG